MQLLLAGHPRLTRSPRDSSCRADADTGIPSRASHLHKYWPSPTAACDNDGRGKGLWNELEWLSKTPLSTGRMR